MATGCGYSEYNKHHLLSKTIWLAVYCVVVVIISSSCHGRRGVVDMYFQGVVGVVVDGVVAITSNRGVNYYQKITYKKK